MVLNYIWIAFFVIAFVVAVCKLLFFGDTQIFTEIINSTFDSSKQHSRFPSDSPVSCPFGSE